jgi:hypothetical protein
MEVLLKKKWLSKGLAFSLVLVILMLFSFTPSFSASCESAYARCILDGILSGFIAPEAALFWTAFCMLGYAWCLEFMG